MLRKMLIQTVACLMIAAVIAAAGQSELTVMRKGAEAVMSYMAVSYSWEDVKKRRRQDLGGICRNDGKSG